MVAVGIAGFNMYGNAGVVESVADIMLQVITEPVRLYNTGLSRHDQMEVNIALVA